MITGVPGFEAAGLACGIKESGAPDLALVTTANRRPVTATGVFTTNLVRAAPVEISLGHLRDGRAAAVVLNSGNANAATGEQGRRDARRMCEVTARELGCDPADVLVCSTGLIGYPLPMEPIEAGIPKLVGALGVDEAAGRAAAEAILTTDTVRKEALAAFEVGTIRVTIGAMAKGAAMLSPSMATMLAVVATDAVVDAAALTSLLQAAVHRSFNSLCIDGATSTNDTVLVLASGAAGNDRADDHLGDALAEVCTSLAEQMAADAEGATKRARVVVCGARSAHEAGAAARAVASSQLVQCSLNGGDPYWGRVLSELGASGADLDPEKVDIAYNAITVCRGGVRADHDSARLAREMAGREIEITCDLHQGSGEARVLTTDLSHAYIDENRGTS